MACNSIQLSNIQSVINYALRDSALITQKPDLKKGSHPIPIRSGGDSWTKVSHELNSMEDVRVTIRDGRWRLATTFVNLDWEGHGGKRRDGMKD